MPDERRFRIPHMGDWIRDHCACYLMRRFRPRTCSIPRYRPLQAGCLSSVDCPNALRNRCAVNSHARAASPPRCSGRVQSLDVRRFHQWTGACSRFPARVRPKRHRSNGFGRSAVIDDSLVVIPGLPEQGYPGWQRPNCRTLDCFAQIFLASWYRPIGSGFC